jgi:putative PIN family toxin of toxin-antitoxin system
MGTQAAFLCGFGAVLWRPTMSVRIVLDTSVLIAGLRSRRGASFRLLAALGSPAITTVISVPLVFEYEAVLRRQADELGLSDADVDDTLDYMCAISEERQIHYLWRPTLPDPKDEFVLELAVEAGCRCIVTHNITDFRGAEKFGLRVLTPAVFLRNIGVER